MKLMELKEFWSKVTYSKASKERTMQGPGTTRGVLWAVLFQGHRIRGFKGLGAGVFIREGLQLWPAFRKIVHLNCCAQLGITVKFQFTFSVIFQHCVNKFVRLSCN